MDGYCDRRFLLTLRMLCCPDFSYIGFYCAAVLYAVTMEIGYAPKISV